MKKQGFTLIELMVVIVIMGILAAVAVPKLFGMIAKSKASEVGPAAGEYIKLQDAYISESGQNIGSWKAIGYTMNTSTPTFTYSDPKTDYANESAAIPTEAAVTWRAAAKVGLNDCTSGSTWNLLLKKAGDANGVNWGASIKKGSTSTSTTDMDADCSILTPQFINFRTNANGTI
ncbi:type IV pilin protein [Fibrobacter sp.]|uniref:type IV pilin protein n=1 Tax=Fibrobacter sp. TaxID=35828 RepID=UPI00388F9705